MNSRKLMRFNRKRHYVLKILSEKFINEELKLVGKRNVNADHFGLTYDEIEKLLKIFPHKRELVLSKLYKANEIVFFDLEKFGCLINRENGMPAFTNKKYINRNRKIMLDWVKNFVQIIIPVLALAITFISLSIKLDSLKTDSDKELQMLKGIVLEQKERVESLELSLEAHPSHIRDSI